MATANADTISLDEREAQSEASDEDLPNVLTNDVFGADDTAATHVVTGVMAGESEEELNSGVGMPIKGTYGYLTLNKDGTYTYKLKTDPSTGKPVDIKDNAQDVFSYTIQDSDGDWSTTTITVNLSPDTTIPTISTPTIGDDAAKVYESSLDEAEGQPAGSDASNTQDRAEGTFTVDLHGESGTLTIGDMTFELDANGNATNLDENNNTFTTEKGTLTITSITNGTVSYTYQLNGAQHHGDVQGPNTLTDEIPISVTDQTGDTSADGSKLTITIVDDDLDWKYQEPIVEHHEGQNGDIVDFDFDNDKPENNTSWVPECARDVLSEKQGDGEVFDHAHWYVEEGRDPNDSKEDGYRSISLQQDGHSVTFSAAIVKYIDVEGDPIDHGSEGGLEEPVTIVDVTNRESQEPLLTFVSTDYKGGESGMAVYSGRRDEYNDRSDGEIGGVDAVISDKPSREAVKITLDGEDAHSITITLNSFYNDGGGDIEKAYIILMNDDAVVGKVLLSGANSANGVVDSTEIRSSEAFNTVYIIPWGQNSDFLLNGVKVGYTYDPVWTASGRVTAVGADGVSGYAFDCEETFQINGNTVITSVDDGGQTVRFFLYSNEDGGGNDRTSLGTATISENGTWKLDWYDNKVTLDSEFTIPIIATDGDGDTAKINLKVSVTLSGTADVDVEPDTSGQSSTTEAAVAVYGIDDADLAFSDAAQNESGPHAVSSLMSSDEGDNFDGDLFIGTDSITGGSDNDLLVSDDAPANLTIDTVEDVKELIGTDDALESFINSVEGTMNDGDDQLFGMDGNDYLNGGEGEDAIFAGSGNDVILYDQNDYMVSGGSGIDFMVSDDSSLTLDDLLAGNGQDKPIVDGIEVLITGEDATSLTNISQLANQYGITLGKNEQGEDTLTLDMEQWTHNANNTYTYNGEGVDLTLQTNLTRETPSDQDAVQQQVFILQNSNG